MYAIVSTGGKQYKVATDDVLNVEKIDGEVGSKVTLPVIFLNDGKKIITDPAKLEKAKVTAEIVEQFKGEKQLVFKFHKRKRYRRLKGHRQQLTRLKITKIQATSRARKAAATTEEAVVMAHLGASDMRIPIQYATHALATLEPTLPRPTSGILPWGYNVPLRT